MALVAPAHASVKGGQYASDALEPRIRTPPLSTRHRTARFRRGGTATTMAAVATLQGASCPKCAGAAGFRVRVMSSRRVVFFSFVCFWVYLAIVLRATSLYSKGYNREEATRAGCYDYQK